MASPGVRFAWGSVRFLFGFALWSLAAVLVFVLADGAVPMWAAWVISGLVVLGLPSLFTKLLLPLFRRFDEGAKWWHVWPGLCGVVALLALALAPMFARDFTGARMLRVESRYPKVPSVVRRLSTQLGMWLAPSHARALTALHGVHGDGGVVGDASQDGGVVTTVTTLTDDDVLAPEDAVTQPTQGDADAAVTDSDAVVSDAVADQSASDSAGDPDEEPDAMAEPPEPVEQLAQAAGSPGEGYTELARIRACDNPSALWMGELSGGGTDEVVVSCGDAIHVFYQQNDAVTERTVLRPRVPAGQSGMMSRAVIADIDGDGPRDLAFCMRFLSEGGGGRGGNAWWARGKTNGQFEAPRSLVGALDCAGVEFGDVTGDGRPELLLVNDHNPYAPTNNLAELVWYEARAARFTRRGAVRLSRAASSIWLDDVTRDGILDVMVHTGWDGVRNNWVIPGARRGPQGVVPNSDVGTDERRFVFPQGRLDGDTRPDAVRIGTQREVHWWVSQSSGRPMQTSATRALDFEEFTP
ncbi:MAG: VCBS repeat-containing protein [Deltaproteobacteria bacterium]|nr:VCBS repeat-containing protein [Deltaproteobacteria bacterium]